MRPGLRPLAALAALAAVAAGVPSSPAALAAGPFPQRFDIHVVGTTLCRDVPPGSGPREFPQMYSSPAVGDLRHDGGREIVAGFPDGTVRAFDASGNPLWSHYLGDAVGASPTLADLRGDGRLEVVIGSWSGEVDVLDPWGNEVPGWPQFTQHGSLGGWAGPGVFSSIAVGDAFGNGGRELFATSIDHWAYGWAANGATLPGWPRPLYDTSVSTPVLADLQGQHRLDVITPADNSGTDPYGHPKGGVYWAWGPDGGLLWSRSVDEVPWASAAAENLGNGVGIVNGTGDYWHVVTGGGQGRYITGYNADGGSRGGFPVGTGSPSFASPAVGDVYGDGGREVVQVTEDGRLRGVYGNGAAAPGFGFALPNPLNIPPPGQFHGGAAIAPVDGSGHNGIWVPAQRHLVGYATSPWGFTQVALLPTPQYGEIFSTPTVADLGDGQLSVLVSSESSAVQCGAQGVWDVTAWTIGGTSTRMPSGAWPTFHGNMLRSGSNLPLAPPPAHGYWLVARDGGIFPFGSAIFHSYGSTGGMRLNQPIVGMARTPSGNGYWLVARDGGIFPFGDAVWHSYGSTGGIRLNQPIVGMAATPSGNGYWLVAADGGIFPFGDAVWHSYGSTGGIRLNQPIVGMLPTRTGNGYWLVASDGGIFPFGDAVWHSYGSTGGIRLNQPIIGMAATSSGNGYWLAARDGGIFPFGDAVWHSYGSLGGQHLNAPIVAMAPTRDGNGYYMVGSDGGVFPFGPSAAGYGSTGAMPLNQPIVDMAATP